MAKKKADVNSRMAAIGLSASESRSKLVAIDARERSTDPESRRDRLDAIGKKLKASLKEIKDTKAKARVQRSIDRISSVMAKFTKD